MIKKILVLLVAALMTLSVFGLTACEPPEYDDGIDPKIRSEIVEWSYLWLDLGQDDGATLEDIGNWMIDLYCGQYNGFHVFHFRRWGFGLTQEVIIDGLSFESPGTLEIFAVSEDYGGTLKKIYENGYITRADLEAIYEAHRNRSR